MIIKSQGNPEVLGQLSGSIFTAGGVTSRTPGEPSSKLVQRIGYLKKLEETTDDLNVKRFAEKQIKSTEREMAEELGRDEARET